MIDHDIWQKCGVKIVFKRRCHQSVGNEWKVAKGISSVVREGKKINRFSVKCRAEKIAKKQFFELKRARGYMKNFVLN